MSTLLSSRQAAASLGVSEDFVRARAAAGDLAYYRMGKLLRFAQADLDDFVERQRVPAAVAPVPVPRRRVARRFTHEMAVEALRTGDFSKIRAAR